MKKLTIVMALLAIALLASCTIPTPAREQNKTVEKNESMMEEVNETIEEVPEEVPEEPVRDLKDVPKKEVIEGDLVSFPNLKATDPDGDPVTYTFTAPLNAKGEWQTKEGDAGEHLITITASDGVNTVKQEVLIIVNPKNKPPVIDIEDVIEVDEGDEAIVEPDVTDPDGDEVTVTLSGWTTENTKATTFDDAGLHKVVITATDGKLTATKEIIVSVKNINRAPEIEDLASVEIKEGEKVTVKAKASDVDGDKITFAYGEPLDATGTWTTKVGDAGEYEVTVTASDGDLNAETSFTLTVTPANRPPVIELDSPVSATEGNLVELEPTITDPEGDEVTVKYSGWMTSSTKQLGYNDEGNHKVTITAADTAGNEAEMEIIVSVEDVNRAPIFGAGSFN
ncbi:MAG TPA: Ig-like domain-containing protein [Candidatus Nanoarchaeia archaeon]|nr:Ig-like domain-containing protein [Candidatus Nanoarchaeia archaeon]